MQSEPKPASVLPKITLGLVLITFGILLLLSNLDLLDGQSALRYWPLFTFIPFGLERFFSKGVLRSTGGHILIFLGLFFQLVMMEKWQLLEKGWPLGLLWIGIVLILRSLMTKPAPSHPEE